MRIAVALALCAMGWIITPAGAAEPPPCPIPEELVTPDEPLTAMRAAIKSHLPIHILAIGSASTNAAPGGPHSSFPYEAVQGLRAALPSTDVTVSVKGGRGLTAAEMVPLIEQGL